MEDNWRTSPNAHNDFMAALLETADDCRGLLALAVAKNKVDDVREKRVTRLPADHPDFRQVVRHLDAVLGMNAGEATGGEEAYEHIYLLEFKSSLSKHSLLRQLLGYILILLRFCTLVTPIVIYTGKRPLPAVRKRIRPHAWLQTLIANRCGVSLTCVVVNIAEVKRTTLLRYAPTIAAGLYLAKHIYHLTEAHIAQFFQLANTMPKVWREKMVEKGCVYIIKCVEGYDWRRLERIEREVVPERRRVVARVAYSREAAVAEGKAEGKAEGRAEGLAEVAQRMLVEGMDIEIICRTTGLTRRELTRLKKKRA